MSGTKQCPHCAEMILADAKVCKHCGRDVNEKKKTPFIGFVGMLLLAIGFCVVVTDLMVGSVVPYFLIVGGGLVLGYALLTGNLSFYGR